MMGQMTAQALTSTLSDDELTLIDSYWRAANYLSVGQIYLMDNPLLREPLRPEQIKPRLLGHWGTTPGLNFIYVHLNRIIRERDRDVLFICGPGHGGPAMVANTTICVNDCSEEARPWLCGKKSIAPMVTAGVRKDRPKE